MVLAMPTEQPGSRYAAGYIRESSEDFGRDLDAQKAGQREDIVMAARKDGTDPATLLWYDDWGRSGSEHAKRPQQERLLADVRAGKVAVIYARSLDRLMRSTQRLRDLWEATKSTGTRIVTLREGDVSGDNIEENPSAWMFVQAIMTAAEYESRVGRVRAKASMATKRRDGTRIGRYDYGKDPNRPEQDVSKVLEAFDAAGSYNGAARFLNDWQVPTRSGGDVLWVGTVVGRIVRVHRRDIAIQPKRQGSAARAPRLFTGLLVCDWCTDHGQNARLTSMPRRVGWNGNKNETIAYYDSKGRALPRHPRPFVIAERKVKPWVEEQLKPYRTIAASRMAKTTPEEAEEVQRQREALEAQRGRLVDMYQGGDIDKGEYEQRRDTIRATLEGLERQGYLLRVLGTPGGLADAPLIDLDGSVADANAELRQLWSAIHLRHIDGILVPDRVDWQPGALEWAEGRGGEDIER
jgi:DNA invertase Pin-like site-specific DNA recombinase